MRVELSDLLGDILICVIYKIVDLEGFMLKQLPVVVASFEPRDETATSG